jgi:hypothetical protein
MPTLSRLLTLRILFTYAIPLLHLAYGYFYVHQMQTQPVPLESWQLLGLLTVDIIGLLVAIRWKNNYLGSLYVALLLLSLGLGLLLAIAQGASQGLNT